MGYSFSRTVPAWVFSMGCSPSGMDCSSVGPPESHKPCQQTCFSVGFSLHGFTGPGRSLLQSEVSMGSQPPLGGSSAVGSSMGCGWRSAPPWTSMGCSRTACLTIIFLRSYRGICSSTWTTSSTSFFTDLGVSKATCLTYFHSFLSGCCSAAGFSPLLK